MCKFDMVCIYFFLFSLPRFDFYRQFLLYWQTGIPLISLNMFWNEMHVIGPRICAMGLSQPAPFAWPKVFCVEDTTHNNKREAFHFHRNKNRLRCASTDLHFNNMLNTDSPHGDKWCWCDIWGNVWQFNKLKFNDSELSNSYRCICQWNQLTI